MSIYDFNTPRYNINSIIDNLRKELRDIVSNSQTSIAQIQEQIAASERTLKYLKDVVDNLPDFSSQYEELLGELNLVKSQLNEMQMHPIILGSVQVEDPEYGSN